MLTCTRVGRAFVTASSCDEYVWELLSAAQERGVRLAPAVMPRKYKIVIYTETAPEVITLDAQLDEDGDEHESAPVDGAEDLSNTTRDKNGTTDGRNSSSSAVDSSSSGVSGGGGDDEENSANRRDSSEVSSEAVGGRQEGGESSGGVTDGDDGDETNRGDGGRRSRRRVLLRGKALLQVYPDSEDGAEATTVVQAAHAIAFPPTMGSAMMPEGGDVVARRGLEIATTAGSSSIESETVAKGTVEAATAAGESMAESEGVEGENGGDAGDGWGLEAKVAPASDAAGAGQTGDWEQVVSYYQSLQLCLQEVRCRLRRCTILVAKPLQQTYVA